MKHNIVILATCAPCASEVKLWRAFIAENKDKFNIIFLSEFEYELDISTNFKIEDLFFDDYAQAIGDELSPILTSIAECEKIWGACDPAASLHRAYSWFHYCKFILKLFRPVTVYVWNGFHLPAKAMLKAAEEFDIDKFVMERGPFANTFVCDRLGLNRDSSFVTAYDAIDCVRDDKAIYEFARIYFERGLSNWEQPITSADRDAFYKKHNIPNNKLLIFFPLQIDNDTNSKLYSPHFISVYDAFSEVIDAANKLHDSIYMLVKKHPKQDDIALYEKAHILSGAVVEDAHIFDCIKYCDAVISINSSSAIEAALVGKTVLLLGESILLLNNKIISIENRHDLYYKLELLSRISARSDDLIDNEFFCKLLFNYLFTTEKNFQVVGINPVEKLPTSTPKLSHDKTCFSQAEVDTMVRLLSSFQLCAKYESSTAAYQHKLEEYESRAAENQHKLEEYESRAAEYESRAAEYNKLLELMNKQIDSIFNSVCWRITKPLRWLGDKLNYNK